MTAKRLPIRMWRVTRAAPFGLHVWFDPDTEFPRLFELEPHSRSGVGDPSEGDDRIRFRDGPEEKKQMFLDEELPFDL